MAFKVPRRTVMVSSSSSMRSEMNSNCREAIDELSGPPVNTTDGVAVVRPCMVTPEGRKPGLGTMR